MVSKWKDYARMTKERAVSASGLATVTTAEAGWATLNWWAKLPAWSQQVACITDLSFTQKMSLKPNINQ